MLIRGTSTDLTSLLITLSSLFKISNVIVIIVSLHEIFKKSSFMSCTYLRSH